MILPDNVTSRTDYTPRGSPVTVYAVGSHEVSVIRYVYGQKNDFYGGVRWRMFHPHSPAAERLPNQLIRDFKTEDEAVQEALFILWKAERS